jgi:hypothetical protein
MFQHPFRHHASSNASPNLSFFCFVERLWAVSSCPSLGPLLAFGPKLSLVLVTENNFHFLKTKNKNNIIDKNKFKLNLD